MTMDGDWHFSTTHGTARSQAAGVHLSLDGRGPGTARAYSPGDLAGDFDVIVNVLFSPGREISNLRSSPEQVRDDALEIRQPIQVLAMCTERWEKVTVHAS